ncbi:MAG: threonine aldolase family protein [Elstera sp.]|jgi:threonine aldolase|uniref:threonine aldolase family protein n=1 Tax=Elstera sp. TaxID=1916664 RepID=UPI0037BE3425
MNTKLNFASDNVAPVPQEILEAIAVANQSSAMPYGADDMTALALRRFRELFECDLEMIAVATGTAANALALACICPPWGEIYCHADAHITESECGAPEFFTNGAKLVHIQGENGKITPDALSRTLAATAPGNPQKTQPAALSLSQATECGTLYQPDEIRTLSEIAHAHGLKVHMDGARFANAVATLATAPSEITWEAGVDVLSFGATKNGAMAAEAVLFFDPNLAAEAAFRRKRGGHLFSKMRFLSAQLAASLADGRWLSWANQANLMAERMVSGLLRVPGTRLLYPREANEVFVTVPEGVADGLEAEGIGFYRWGGPGSSDLRFVTNWGTKPEDVDYLVDRALMHAARGGRTA